MGVTIHESIELVFGDNTAVYRLLAIFLHRHIADAHLFSRTLGHTRRDVLVLLLLNLAVSLEALETLLGHPFNLRAAHLVLSCFDTNRSLEGL